MACAHSTSSDSSVAQPLVPDAVTCRSEVPPLWFSTVNVGPPVLNGASRRGVERGRVADDVGIVIGVDNGDRLACAEPVREP